MTLKKAFAPIGKFIAAGSRSVAKLKEMTLSQLSGATMSMKKLFAPFKGVIVAGAVPATKLRFAPRRVNHSQNPQIKEVIMSIIKKLVASFVGLNPAGPRSAMKLLSVLLAFILGATLWVGPTAAAEMKNVTDPSTGKVVTAPTYGGRLTFAMKLEPPHTDPWFTHSPGAAISGVAEKLGIGNWGIDRDEFSFSSQYIALSAFTGALAESWEQPDPLTYVFKIRQGVHWHDKAPMNGRALTAKDIEYNYHRYLALGSGFTEVSPGGSASFIKPLPWESITATDDATVVMRLKEPNLKALKLILDAATFMLPPEVIQQYGDAKDWRRFVGTGPYRLTDWVDGSSMTWTKNPDYWDTDEKYPQNRLPYVDELKGQIIKEEATRLAGMRSGKIDYLGFPAGDSHITSLDQIESFRRTNPEIVLNPWWDRAETIFALDATKPPFDDIRVRQAMQMALDLETINNTYFKGTANATPQGVIGDRISGFYIPFEQWPEAVKKGYRYDPEEAKKLLKEAGYPNGFKTVVNHFAEFDLNYTELAVEYWKAIGVDAEIKPFDRASMMPMVNERTWEGPFGTIGGWNMDAAFLVRWRGHSSSIPWNLSGIKDPELDAIIEAVEAATTIEEQMKHARQADMVLIEQQGYVWGPHPAKFNSNQPWVKGYNGEVQLGSMDRLVIFSRLWIDQELKKEMGF